MPSDHRQLRRFLPRNGFNWGVEANILARHRRDRMVVHDLLELGVRARPANVQVFFTGIFDDATRFVGRHQLPDDMSLGGFCAEFGRRNALGRKVGPVVFGDLFEALIFGRVRFLQRAEEVGLGNQPQAGIAVARLALAIDAFVAASPHVDNDSTRALVAADVDEDVTEVAWDETRGAWRVAAASNNSEAELLALTEDLVGMGVEREDEGEEAVNDDIDGMDIDV